MPPTRPIRLRLHSVRLERFKAAFKPAAPILFHSFNAFIGRNGAGKSTVLEALQWIDAAIRSDIIQACSRYNGVGDLINSRARQQLRNFKIDLSWTWDEHEGASVFYSVKIGAEKDGRTPFVVEETLDILIDGTLSHIIYTEPKSRQRLLQVTPSEAQPFPYSENLLIATALARESRGQIGRHLKSLREFWQRSVFLRLSPNELAKNAPARSASFDPILNETGRSLPALLRGFEVSQLKRLIESIQRILPDFTGIEVSSPIIPQGDVFFSLWETMPSRGRSGKRRVVVPAWMLSEGTRRITAILAVLQHEPPPTFLCIEEIENGLDPWSVISIIHELRSASDSGTQVVFTTHSPWLLDHVEYDDIIKVERIGGDTVYSRFADLDAVKAYGGSVPPGAVYATEG